MSNTVVLRPLGQTTALSVTSSSHASITIPRGSNDQSNYAAFLNLGAAAIAIETSALDTAPASTVPVDGTPGSFILPPLMTLPIILAVPTAPFQMTAISSGATGLLYVTLVDNQ